MIHRRLRAHVEAFVLDDARCNVGKDAFSGALVRLQLPRDAQYFAALAHEELEVIVRTLVGQLSESGGL